MNWFQVLSLHVKNSHIMTPLYALKLAFSISIHKVDTIRFELGELLGTYGNWPIMTQGPRIKHRLLGSFTAFHILLLKSNLNTRNPAVLYGCLPTSLISSHSLVSWDLQSIPRWFNQTLHSKDGMCEWVPHEWLAHHRHHIDSSFPIDSRYRSCLCNGTDVYHYYIRWKWIMKINILFLFMFW